MQQIELKDGQQHIILELIADVPVAWIDLNGLSRLEGAIRTLHAMAPISTVTFAVGPIRAQHTLETTLQDGRTATFVFSDVSLSNYTINIGSAPWPEAQSYQLREITEAIKSLHREFPISTFTWHVHP